MNFAVRIKLSKKIIDSDLIGDSEFNRRVLFVNNYSLHAN